LTQGARPDVRNDVRERRLRRRLSQADLAAAMGVSRQTINSIETGRYLPSLPLALSLARYFTTTVEEMFDAECDRAEPDRAEPHRQLESS
jgi:putative transcriptional regulator